VKEELLVTVFANVIAAIVITALRRIVL